MAAAAKSWSFPKDGECGDPKSEKDGAGEKGDGGRVELDRKGGKADPRSHKLQDSIYTAD